MKRNMYIAPATQQASLFVGQEPLMTAINGSGHRTSEIPPIITPGEPIYAD